ncbi:hypothetical protein G7Y89_g10718 [Cudoniella acicularis]|uniref:Uncharacterized protein n=1 Tax=Cudoniella acicularis TaxID=354080 RepID=A0A8H4RC81_9HELO|nr:hypothetical protein G7Y89_g10718 [Cudoniella acicularis]
MSGLDIGEVGCYESNKVVADDHTDLETDMTAALAKVFGGGMDEVEGGAKKKGCCGNGCGGCMGNNKITLRKAKKEKKKEEPEKQQAFVGPLFYEL